MRKKQLIILSIIFTLIFSVNVFAADGSEVEVSLGFLTLLPPLIAIALAFITKNVIMSLFLGAISGTFILAITSNENTGFISILFSSIIASFLDLINKILESLADPWNAGIILQVLAIGGVIALISKMGGAKAVAISLSKKSKTRVSSQIITFILGLLVFFDDYANSLIVGPIMRPVFDKMKISREKLAFIVDATAAPIAGIAVISTWIGYEIGLIQKGLDAIAVDQSGFNIFLQTIPFRFYNIFMLAFVVIGALTLREFGPMKEAEKRAREGNIGDNDKITTDEDHSVKEGITPKMINAIVPIATLIGASLLSFYFSGYNTLMADGSQADIAIITGGLSFANLQLCIGNADASTALFQSAIFAGIVAIVMGVAQKIFTISEAIDTWVDGMKTLVVTGVVLLLAWSLSSVISDLGTATFLTSILETTVPKFLLPSLIFLLGSVISFSTGTSYGTMGILMPLAIPISYTIGGGDLNYTIVCTSAVLTGAIFGDHCSPISDTTILSSMGSGCNHINHVRTQLPYAVFVGLITVVFGYLPAGFGITYLILIPIAIVALFGGLMFIGEKVE